MEKFYSFYVKRGEKEMNVRDIEIDKIKQLENVRLRIEDKDVHTLMSSIKQDGLLEPIGVSTTKGIKDEYLIVYGNRRLQACRKLGWKTIPAIIDNAIVLKDFVIKNTLENVEREQITESELGRIFYMLKNDYNMTNSELSSRFGFPLCRVKTALNIYSKIPEEYRPKIKHNLMGSKKGNIPAKSADIIINMKRKFNLNKDSTIALLEESRKDGFSYRHLETVSSLLSMGYNADQSVEIANKYNMVSVSIPILKDEIKRIKEKYKIPLNRIIFEVLNGKIKDKINVPDWKNGQ